VFVEEMGVGEIGCEVDHRTHLTQDETRKVRFCKSDGEISAFIKRENLLTGGVIVRYFGEHLYHEVSLGFRDCLPFILSSYCLRHNYEFRTISVHSAG
jgi:hypothetical protein